MYVSSMSILIIGRRQTNKKILFVQKFGTRKNCQQEEDRIHSVFQMVTKVTQMKSPLRNTGKPTISWEPHKTMGRDQRYIDTNLMFMNETVKYVSPTHSPS